MNTKLSVLMITKNAEETIQASLESIDGLADEIIVVDDFSNDNTLNIAQRYTRKIYKHHQINLGSQKQYALNKTSKEWVLCLDSDEVVPEKLKLEIEKILSDKKISYEGFLIPYQNHFLGRKIRFGGENYKKLILFKKNTVTLTSHLIHERFVLSSKPGIIKEKMIHYSYRSIFQTYKKFSKYAYLTALQQKQEEKNISIKKIFLYPPHMFWARFIEDKGYKDGFFRIPLDLGFAYMEFLTYVLMLFPLKNKKS